MTNTEDTLPWPRAVMDHPTSVVGDNARTRARLDNIEYVLSMLEASNGYREGGDVWIGPALGTIRDQMAYIAADHGRPGE